MNMGEALQFISFHEQKKARARSEERANASAQQSAFLSFQKADLAERKFAYQQEKGDLAERKFGLEQEKFGLSQKKFAFSYAKEMIAAKDKEVEQEKGVIASLITSYRQGNLAEKNAVTETMKSYYHTLDRHSRAKLDPFVQFGSPISDTAIKAQEFDAMRPMPMAPPEEELRNNPRLGAQYLFDVDERACAKEKVVFGTERERKRLIMIDKDFGAFKGEDGVAQLLNNEDVKLHLAAQKTGISLVDFYKNNGVIREDEPSAYTTEGGQLVGVYQERDYLAKQGSQIKHASKRLGAAPKTEVTIPPDIRELLHDITFHNEDNVKAMHMKKMLFQGDAERKALIDTLQETTENLSFRLDKMRELDWFDKYLWLPLRDMPYFWKQPTKERMIKQRREAEGFSLRVIQGNETAIEIPRYGLRQFYITPDGTIRNGDNRVIGHTREQSNFVSRIAKEFDSIPDMLKTKKVKVASDGI